ncbi:hypothetical protein BV25DRAFT_1712756 [Artomyces pyxidatus]|uniref:Uncharacterized protein n=1 Tax=Artomyces pyxidatus TaxID=48021 RepID=A0ACB8TAQ5_9AGAM|nr:hypothetical protein BV25DRAFT_1712756 [Artomyces pyxidatus]
MVELLIDGQLFRVERKLLEGGSLLGSEPAENPIVIPDVTGREFELLLDFLTSKSRKSPKLTREEWVDLFKISSRLQFDAVRLRAIDGVAQSDLDPVEVMLLSMEHSVHEWMRPALAKYIAQEEVVTETQASKLPLGFLTRLWKAQLLYQTIKAGNSVGRVWIQQFGVGHPRQSTHPAPDVQEIIARCFDGSGYLH